MQFNKTTISILVASVFYYSGVQATTSPEVTVDMNKYRNTNNKSTGLGVSQSKRLDNDSKFKWQIGSIASFTPELYTATMIKRANGIKGTHNKTGLKKYSSLSNSEKNSAALNYYFEQITANYVLLNSSKKSTISQSKLVHIHDTGRGGIIGKYQQEIDGVEVFGLEISLLMNRQQELIASSGYFSAAKSVPLKNYSVTIEQALEIAFKTNTGVLSTFPITLLEKKVKANFNSKAELTEFKWLVDEASSEAVYLSKNSRVKKVFFPISTKTLIPAYYVEAETVKKGSRASEFYSYVIDAQTGKVLFENNLTAHVETTYKVFAESSGDNIPFDGPQGNLLTPHPTGDIADTPVVDGEFLAVQNSITLDYGPISTQDPWLSEMATTTTGNNVDAYADISGEDGFDDVDIRPVMSSANAFEFEAASFSGGLSGDPQQQAVVNLFYTNNFLHDWFYDNGFDETSGNAQTSNLGRGGLENDALLVEAQDSSGTNNANMSTPSDGNAPKMQMFIWTFLSDSSMTITGVTDIVTRAAGFGPADYDTSGVMSLVDDGTAPIGDACETIATDLTDKIAIIDRGDCNFTVKVKGAQDQGAIGVIMVNNVDGDPIVQGGEDETVTIPSMMVTMAKGAEIKSALADDSMLQAQLFNLQKPLDGTLDNGIVAHEWGHYLTNRLVGNSNGLSNNQGRSMGEGWSDFVALLMIAKETDNLIAGNEEFQGVYSASTFVGDAYNGIRRTPYSTDMGKNALTFKHIENGVALPDTHPVAFGASGVNNSQVHASGEIWANTLWEGFVGLINKPGNSFEQAQESMKDYLVGGLKMTPNAPTMLEARDAILAVAAVSNAEDFLILREAFTKRGMGGGAVAPDRESGTHAGVVEDFMPGRDVSSVISIDKSIINDTCDNDGILDPTESVNISLMYASFTNKSVPNFSATLTSVDDVTFDSNSLDINSLASFGNTDTQSTRMVLNTATHMQSIQITGVNNQIGNADDDFIESDDVSSSIVTNLDFSQTLSSDNMSEPLTSNFDWEAVAGDNLASFVVSNGAWYGEDSGAPGTSDLTTPIIRVSASGEFKIDFDHFYFFESSEDTNGVLINWDAGVVEISIDGASFVDVTTVGGVLTEAYNGTVDAFNESLGGRNAYTFTRDQNELIFSPNSLSFADGLVNGHDVRVRFRVGTDANTGDFGWLIDNVVVTNALDPIFSEIVAEDNVCVIGSAPTADAGVNQTLIGRDANDIAVNLTGTATDTDGDALTLEWTQRAGPTVTINNSDTLNASINIESPLVETEYVFQLSASDATRTTTDLIAITAKPNSAPTVSATGGSVSEGGSFTLNATGSDDDDDNLTFIWSQTAGQNVTLSDTSIANPSFTAPQVESTEILTFEVIVSDGTLSSAPATTNVSVTDTPEPASSGGGGTLNWFLLSFLAIMRRTKKSMIKLG